MHEDLDSIFQALSDPTRREILEILKEGARSTGDLAEAFPVTRPAVSRHLRVLHEAGLVERRKEGRRQIYDVTPGSLDHAQRWLFEYAGHWRGSLRRLKALVELEDDPSRGSSPDAVEGSDV